MKSRKSIFKIEDSMAGPFLSMTHYSRKDKRLYKGRRVPYDVTCTHNFFENVFQNEEWYLRAQLIVPYGRQDIEMYINKSTARLIDRIEPFKIYLSMARCAQLERDSWK